MACPKLTKTVWGCKSLSSGAQKTGVKNIFNYFKQALNGSEQDFTSGSIRKAVFLLAIPMILEMMMESVFAVVDIFFVGRINNTNKLT